MKKPVHQNKQSKLMQETSDNITQKSTQKHLEQEQEIDIPITNEAFKKLQEDLAESNNKYVRLYAEFDNFRKRMAKEKLALTETANEAIIKQLLSVVDDFDRAIVAMAIESSHHNQSYAAIQQGVQLIYDKLKYLLQQAGVKVMDIEKGSNFDAELQEAVTQVPVEDALKGKIVEIIEKGYYLKDRVLRFAKVVIGV